MSLFVCFDFHSGVHRDGKVHYSGSPIFSGVGLGDLFVSQNPRTVSGLCIYHLMGWTNFKFLHNFQWITFPNPVVSSHISPLILYCHIIYTCNFVGTYLFSLYNNRFLCTKGPTFCAVKKEVRRKRNTQTRS